MSTSSPYPPGLLAPALPARDDRNWARNAINILQGDGLRSPDTHLINPVFRGLRGISFYLKDESTHPTGSLKHRLAHSLFLYGICNGKILQGTTLVEASSGSTAVSEAYFANCRLLQSYRDPRAVRRLRRSSGSAEAANSSTARPRSMMLPRGWPTRLADTILISSPMRKNPPGW